ncbi:putative oxidoreductase [Mycolicibacterium aubagnense]
MVVTGGASNIGRGIVHEFAAEGARIVISDIDGPQAEKVRAEALAKGAAEVEVAIGDLTTAEGADTAIGTALRAWDGINVLVNNAGWSVPGFIATDTDRDKWQRTIEINLFSAIGTTQAAIGPMKEAGDGAIVFIASDAAFGQIRQGVYGASKAAMVALARTTAREHGRHGIRSNIVCPGLVIPDGPDAVSRRQPVVGGSGQRLQPVPDQLHDQGHPNAPADHGCRCRTGGAVLLITQGRQTGYRTNDLGQRWLHHALSCAHPTAARSLSARSTSARSIPLVSRAKANATSVTTQAPAR